MTRERLAGAALALVVFEIVLRVLVHGHPTLHPQRGWIYQNTTVRQWLSEGHATSHWDAGGFRDSPCRPVNPSTRILVLGDSMTEGLSVADDDVYTGQLECELQWAGWSPVVLNAGHSALSAADYIATAQYYRDEMNPGWTVIQLRTDDLTTDGRVSSRTHFVDSQTGLAVERVQPRFGRFSRILARFRQSSDLVDAGIARAQLFNAASRLPPLFGGDDSASRQTATPIERRYPIEDELTMLAGSWGGRLTIALIPEPDDAPNEVELRIVAHAKARGLSLVNLRETFAQFDRGHSSPFGFSNSRYGRGHLNAEGNRALAVLLATELKALHRLGLF